MRRKHSPQLKAKAALEALRGLRPVNEIAGEYEVHPSQVTQWKKQAKDSLPEIFRRPTKRKSEAEDLTPKLCEEIGRLKMEVDWLKKKSAEL